MQNGIHFISGLPRAGSTLLAVLLWQNPAVHAHITSPMGSLMGTLLHEMSQGNETAIFVDDAQRESLLRGLFEGYYRAIHPTKTVFDTNRGWTARIDLLAALYPQAKFICCVRPIPWIIDSVERLIRRNRWQLSKIFAFDAGGTVYTRAEGLMSNQGLIGYPLSALKQSMFSAEAGRLLLLPYDTLVRTPQAAMQAVYEFTGLAPFAHDFQNVQFSTTKFDAGLGTPGLHDVRSVIAPEERQTILPADLWRQYEGASIWRDPEFSAKGARILAV